MQKLISGASVEDAIKVAVERDRLANNDNLLSEIEVKSGRFDVPAPPLFWGPWVVVGHVSTWHDSSINKRSTQEVKVSFGTNVRAGATFDIEIKTGNQLIRTVGPGSTTLTLPASVITSISARCKSHLLGQRITVSVSGPI